MDTPQNGEHETKSEVVDALVRAMRENAVFQLTPGGVINDRSLAAFSGCTSRQVREDVFRRVDGRGCPCDRLMGCDNSTVDAFAEWLAGRLTVHQPNPKKKRKR